MSLYRESSGAAALECERLLSVCRDYVHHPISQPSTLVRTTLLLSILLMIGGMLLLSPPAFSAQAAFNDTSDRVVIIGYDEPPAEIDITNRTGRRIAIPATVSGDLVAISPFRKGKFLCATTTTLFASDQHLTHFSRICDSPTTAGIEDIAYNALNDRIVLTTADASDDLDYGAPYWEGTMHEGRSLFVLHPDSSQTSAVRCRRVGFVTAPVYDRHGNLLFATRGGDLWRGKMEDVSMPSTPSEPTPHWTDITATRIAPLATQEGFNGTGMQMGVIEIAVGLGDSVYVALHRISGSGWGSIVRLKLPLETASTNEELSFAAWSHYRGRALLSVQGVSDDVSRCLCASRDGRRIFYRTGSSAGQTLQTMCLMLVENNGSPKQLHIR